MRGILEIASLVPLPSEVNDSWDCQSGVGWPPPDLNGDHVIAWGNAWELN
jgi:hypothetical protein